jgi:putative IMPACT (imprinted ancient) family translation regulator
MDNKMKKNLHLKCNFTWASGFETVQETNDLQRQSHVFILMIHPSRVMR